MFLCRCYVTTDKETSEQLYGRFDECSLTSRYNTTICVYHCQCQMAAQRIWIHLTVMNNNCTLCGIDIVATHGHEVQLVDHFNINPKLFQCSLVLSPGVTLHPNCQISIIVFSHHLPHPTSSQVSPTGCIFSLLR